MKKLTIIMIIALFICSLSFADYVHYGHNVKCAKCVELHEKDAGLEQQIAWRTHERKNVNGKAYALYKCPGGHKYWAEIR